MDPDLTCEKVPPPPIVRAAWQDPLDSALLLALADWIDERAAGPSGLLDGMRWRMHAEPENDRWRLAYADILDDLGSDRRLHAEFIRVMCAHPDWFESGTYNAARQRSFRPMFAAAMAFVSQNADLIAWADLDLQTGSVQGSFIWKRVQAEIDSGAGTEGPVHVSFRRGFVYEVRARLGSLLGRACSLWRHPVTLPHCLDRLPWRAVNPDPPGYWGWWDVNIAIPSDDDSATLPTELMLAMNDDPSRTDRTIGTRFEPDKGGMGGCCLFGSREDAEAALRRALVVYGRRAALVPPDCRPSPPRPPCRHLIGGRKGTGWD